MNGLFLTVAAAPTSLAEALQGVDFSIMTTDLFSVIPILMIPCLTWLGIRKTVSFVLGILRGC